MLKVLIADDHSLFRRGVKDLLIHELGPVTIGECGDTHELLEQIGCKKWDLLIMDIGMPGTTGVEALKRVKAECPELPVIILSMHPEDQYAVRMFKAGASAYLMKASASDELVKAIHKVRGGWTICERRARRETGAPASSGHRPAARTAVGSRV